MLGRASRREVVLIEMLGRASRREVVLIER